ncbi:neuron-specific calcium-binding protein hippocalcin [Pelomyxa schiedti]|nr:neuron-specific calcium-binding protein hippocalcin [Pelomyxa schiedti]
MGAEDSKLKSDITSRYPVNEEEFKRLVARFKSIQVNNKITKEVFLANMPHNVPREASELIFDSFDKDGSGALDSGEFLQYAAINQFGTLEQKLEASFAVFDSDGNGYLTRSEIASILELIAKQQKVLDAAMKREITTSLVPKIFAAVDTDHNEKIDKNEFIQGFKANPQICHFFKLL